MNALAILLGASLAVAQSNAPSPSTAEAKPVAPSLRAAVPNGTINIPDEIAPATMPYMGCLMAARGTNLRLSSGQRDPRPADIAIGGDCSPHRAEAARRANDMLRGQHRMNAESRHALVEATLNEVDQFVGPGESLGRTDLRNSAASGRDRDSDPMRPIEVPYQAIPAYSAYAGCVATHLRSDSRVGGADVAAVRQARADAIGACRDVRAQQLARALAAQTDNRPFGSARLARAAVRRAFDRFDSDYQIETIGGPEPTPPKGQ